MTDHDTARLAEMQAELECIARVVELEAMLCGCLAPAIEDDQTALPMRYYSRYATKDWPPSSRG